MQDLVIKFAHCSRAAGLRVSSSEVLDTLAQLPLVDVLDEGQFKAVLRANFVKTHRDTNRFERLYHLFFHELRTDVGPGQGQSIMEDMAPLLDELRQENPDDSMRRALLDFIEGDPTSYLDQLRELQTEADAENQGKGQFQKGQGTNLGMLTRRLAVDMLLRAIEQAMEQRLGYESGIRWQTRRDIREHVKNRMDNAYRLLMQEDRPDQDMVRKVSHAEYVAQLGDRNFAALTPDEVEEMRDVITHLVRRLKDTISRRYASRNRGVLDVKKTIRNASRYEGVPVELIWRKRPPNRGKVVTLCDVSGSVWSAARFMLNMLYSVQECFTGVRSFIFVAGVADVTPIFERYEINTAIEQVLKETDLAYGAPTDYGATFRQFRQEFMDVLNKKTTVIIIGDGRTNYFNPEEAILDEMRERSRRIIWLNPETETFWNTGDSEMKTYSAYCNEVRPCRNLNQLLDFIKDLVL
ncbi:MAG: vWA domain-containing protein [Desulfatibacillaceae bacterium]